MCSWEASHRLSTTNRRVRRIWVDGDDTASTLVWYGMVEVSEPCTSDDTSLPPFGEAVSIAPAGMTRKGITDVCSPAVLLYGSRQGRGVCSRSDAPQGTDQVGSPCGLAQPSFRLRSLVNSLDDTKGIQLWCLVGVQVSGPSPSTQPRELLGFARGS